MPDLTPPPSPRPQQPTTLGGLLWAVLLLAAAFLGAHFSTQPPAALDAQAPPERFSAHRALATLQTVLGAELPHPVGSDEHAAVQARLERELSALGLEPQVQSTIARGPSGTYARVNNVLARLPGRGTGPAVLFSAHYDSVGAGPGAADDGAGVACLLESARLLQLQAPLARDVILLFSDGEEVGLVGAAAFAQAHPWFEEVGAVVNLEMRGASGRALLFETGPNSGPAIAAWARRTQRPASNSLAAEVYRRMPNDTDFSVYREYGLPGANLAAIGDVSAYHRPQDRTERIELDTLEHLGNEALDLVRTLADEPLPREGDGERVYSDILGRFVVGWPASWTSALALLSLALAALTILRLRRAEVIGVSEVIAGAIGLTALVVVAAGLGLLWTRVLQELSGSEVPWNAAPTASRASYAALALFATLVVARTVGRTAGFWGLWCAGLVLSSLAALALALLAPGVAFYFLIPALVGGLLPHVSTAMRSPTEGRSREIALSLTLAASAVLWLPINLEIELALGIGAAMVHVVLFALVGALLAPLIAALGTGTGALLGTLSLLLVVGTGYWTAQHPPYDAEHPQTLNLFYIADGDTNEARFAWWTPRDSVPSGAREALGAEVSDVDLWGWAARPMLVPTPDRDDGDAPIEVPAATAPTWGALAPVVELEANHDSGAGRRLRARLRSLRFAEGLHLCLPDGAEIETVAIGEREWPEAELRAAQVAREDEEIPPQLSFFGLGDSAVEVQWLQPGDEPFTVFDSSNQLPPAASAVLAARPAAAQPAYTGDVSILFRRVEP